MDLLHEIFRFLEILLLCGVALIALFVGLIVVAMKMPEDNPLRMLLTRLAWRFAATGGILMVDPVVTPIPVVGELVDVVTLVFLVYYWYTFFRQALNPPRHPPSAPSGRGPTVIERDRPPLMGRIRR